MAESADLNSTLARHINCLNDSNKMTRKKALESIRTEILNRSAPLNQPNLQKVFNDLLKPLLKVFHDTSESCRELVIEMVTELISRVPEPCECLPYLIPILVQRLGQPDYVEPSEEIRLLLVKLARQLVEISGKSIGVYLDDFVKILQRTIVDSYPEVKKESCSLASCLSKVIPEKFHMQSESLINPLLRSLTHQHSKVRICVVEAIGDVIQNGNNKSVDDVRGHLAQRLFDQSQAVRMAVIKVTGEWLLNLMDRYSFHHKLIPLLLTGLTDEQPQITQVATGFWHDIGLKYEQENEKDLKDQMDFPASPPENYPPNTTRPNLGCRVLVSRHVSKILPCLMNDLTDWVVATRIQAAKLLYPLLINTEEKIVQHLPLILNGMYSSCKDSEKEVVQNILKSAELIGYFVEAEVWTALILEELSKSQCPSVLMVLAAIIKGCKQNQLKDHLVVVCDKLASPDLCHTTKARMLAELVKCSKNIILVSKEDCVSVGYQLFSILVTALALSFPENNSDVESQARSCLCDLTLMHHMTPGSCQLYAQYSHQLVSKLKENYTDWISTSFEVRIFETIFFNVGVDVLPELVDDLIEVMCCCLNPDKEDQLRMRMMAMLVALLSQHMSKTAVHPLRHNSLLLLKKIVIPNLVWKAGRIAKSIRFSAISTAWSLFQCGCISDEDLMKIIDELLPQLMTTLQDDNKNTRLLTCRLLIRLLEKLSCIEPPNYDMLHSIYPHLLTRLDDNEDDIRLMVTNVFLAYFDALNPRKYDVGLFRAHLEALYKGLVIHLDDQEVKIQKAVFDVLMTAGLLDKGLLITELERVMHKHRRQNYCKLLIEKFTHKSRK